MSEEKKRRKPAGAAVPGAVQRPTKYPRTTSFMISEELFAAIADEATKTGQSKGDVCRAWLEAGMRCGTGKSVEVTQPEQVVEKAPRRPKSKGWLI